MTPSTRGPWRALIAILAVFATQFSLVRWTNFYGFDEWTVNFMASRGIMENPYTSRPLGHLAALPAPFLKPYSFLPYSVLYGIYIFLSAWIVYLLVRRLTTDRPRLAVLTACIFLVWSPSDYARLGTVERTLYGGIILVMLLAALLFVRSWLLRSEVLLATALLTAFVSARTYEGTIPFLMAVPLLLAGLNSLRERRLWAWAAAWEAFQALALVLVLQPFLFGSEGGHLHQSDLPISLDPRVLLERVWVQYRLHLGPLVASPLAELAWLAVPIAVAVFLAAWAASPEGKGDQDVTREPLAWSMAAGLLLAGLGYSLLVVGNSSAQGAWRMQFISAPGIALFLAAGVYWIGSILRGRARSIAVAVLGAWIVAVGTGRTMALQRRFDAGSFYDRQIRMLSGLCRLAPDLAPHTLVILIDDGQAWRATFGFRHAVEYLYRRRAAGYVWDTWDGMFPTVFRREGILCEPWEGVRRAWDEPTTLYRYDEVVAVRFTALGEVLLEPQWPAALPPLPRGARYDPGARVTQGGPPVPERAILEPLRSPLFFTGRP